MLELDDISRMIVTELQADARISFRDLGAKVGLSAPATAERVRRLERQGVIRGYQADIDPVVLGFPIHAVIRLNAPRDAGIDTMVGDRPEVVECHRVTGSESHVVRAVVRSTEHLEELLHFFWEHGETVTNIVTSSPVPRRPLGVAALLSDG